MGKAWDALEVLTLRQAINEGKSRKQICKYFPERSAKSVYRKIERLEKVEVIPSPQKTENITELWDEYEKKNKDTINKTGKGHKFKAMFKGKQPIGISFLSDQHIAKGSCDLQRMREDAEYIRDTDNLYCCLLGDGVDNHIKHKSAIIQAGSTPDEQYKLYNHYLGILADKVVVAISGNHDLWSMDVAGIDMVKHLAKKNKIHYSRDSAFIELTLGGITYSLAFRHQYKMNSSFNQTHAVKQWLRLGTEEFDIGAIGHHHEAAIESFFYRGKETWVCRPGAYQTSSYYSSKYGFTTSVPTCPTFILFPGRREIVGFSNVYHAGAFLEYLNR